MAKLKNLYRSRDTVPQGTCADLKGQLVTASTGPDPTLWPLGSLDRTQWKGSVHPTIAFHVPSYVLSASEGLFLGQAKTPTPHRSLQATVHPTRLAQGGWWPVPSQPPCFLK